MIKYGVFNAKSGVTDFVSTQTEAEDLFIQYAKELLKEHFHGTAYVAVEVDENGVETWKNTEGDQIEAILSDKDARRKVLGIARPTTVESV